MQDLRFSLPLILMYFRDITKSSCKFMVDNVTLGYVPHDYFHDGLLKLLNPRYIWENLFMLISLAHDNLARYNLI
jgi:hypothetical protein